MSMKIKTRDLLAEGWSGQHHHLNAVLRRARELDLEFPDRDTLFAQLEREFPKEVAVQTPRTAPAPLAEAVEAETPDELASVAAARQRMTELLHAPVIQRGALMPDTCPAGNAPATIPVGGAIAVENALIPGAHSADICCSLFATFFADNHPTDQLMNQLEKVTHFGPGGRPRGHQFTSPVLDEPVWDNLFLVGLRSRAQNFLGT